MVRPTTLFAALPLLALMLGACSASEDDTSSGDSDLTHRTNPSGGMGTLKLDTPSWYDPAVFKSNIVVYDTRSLHNLFNGTLPSPAATLTQSGSAQLAPGSYQIQVRPEGMTTRVGNSYGIIGLADPAVDITSGNTVVFSPAALQATADRPIVWPSAIEAAAVIGDPSVIVGMRQGALMTPSSRDVVATVNWSGRTASVLLPAQSYVVNGKTYDLQPGVLTKLPDVKTKSFAVDLDPVSSDFPTTGGSCVAFHSGSFSEPVRSLQAFATAVVPEDFEAKLTAFGVEVTPSSTANGVYHYSLNRIELQDVQVGSSPTRVRGTAVVEMKSSNGAYFKLECGSAFPTGSAIDVPNGSYRVTSTAQTSSGPISSVEEFSLP